VNQDGFLQLPEDHRGIPDKITIQRAVLNGLAILRDDKGISLDRTWTYEELAAALYDLLPHLFAYFERMQQESGNSDSDDEDASGNKPAWYLASIVKKQLQIVPANFPTGADADYNKGAGTTGWRNNRLWIGP
jgi:hypothetical protein